MRNITAEMLLAMPENELDKACIMISNNVYYAALAHDQVALKSAIDLSHERMTERQILLIAARTERIYLPAILRLIAEQDVNAVDFCLLHLEDEIHYFIAADKIACEAAYYENESVVALMRAKGVQMGFERAVIEKIAQGIARRGDRKALEMLLTPEGIYIEAVAEGLGQGGHFEFSEEMIAREPLWIHATASGAASYGYFHKAISFVDRGAHAVSVYISTRNSHKQAGREEAIKELQVRLLIGNDPHTMNAATIGTTVSYHNGEYYFRNHIGGAIEETTIKRAKRVVALLQNTPGLTISSALQIANKENVAALQLMVAAVAFSNRSKFTKKTGIPTEIMMHILQFVYDYPDGRHPTIPANRVTGFGLFLSRLLPVKDDKKESMNHSNRSGPLPLT